MSENEWNQRDDPPTLHEKIARAIACDDGEGIESAKLDATNILQAIREPTDKMLLAVWPEGLGSLGVRERLRLKADWMRMIDAAIAEADRGKPR